MMKSKATFIDGASFTIDKLSELINESDPVVYVITRCDTVLKQSILKKFKAPGVNFITRKTVLKPGSIYLIEEGLSFNFDGEEIEITYSKLDFLWHELKKNKLNEIYLIRDDLKIIDANQTALNNIGYPAKILKNKYAYDILSRFNESSFSDFLKPLKSGKKDQIYLECVQKRSDNSTYSVRCSFTLFKDHGNSYLVYRALDVSRQIEALQDAKIKAEYLDALATNFPGGSISLLDADLNFLFTGGDSYSRLNIDPGEIKGKNAKEILNPDIYALLNDAKNNLKVKESHSYPSTYQDRAYINLLKPIYQDESFLYYVLTVTDNTLFEEQQNRLRIEKNNHEAISNALYRSALVSITDKKGIITDANESFCEASKYKLKELIGSSHKIVNSGYHSNEFWREMWQTVKGGNTWRAEVKNKARDGSYYWVDTVINPILDVEGNIKSFLSVRYLITERKELEFNLLQITNKFVLASQAAGIGVWTLDTDTREITWDIQIRGISELGFFRGKVEDWLNFIHPDDRSHVAHIISPEKYEKDDFELETRLVTRTGELYYLSLKASLERRENNSTRAIGLTWDITKEKLAHQNLEEVLKDREVMYKELHHRIKNNLQMVNSLLYIRGTYTSNEILKEFIKDTSTKINSISAIHEKLLQLTPMNQLNINEYLITLCDNIANTYSDRKRTYTLDIRVVSDLFDVDTALSLGLIINEILSNTIKYAYPEGGGLISVSLQKKGEEYILKASDNGIGIKPERKEKMTSSYGMQLIQLFVRQIEGSIKIKHQQGTSYTIRFKKPTKE